FGDSSAAEASRATKLLVEPLLRGTPLLRCISAFPHRARSLGTQPQRLPRQRRRGRISSGILSLLAISADPSKPSPRPAAPSSAPRQLTNARATTPLNQRWSHQRRIFVNSSFQLQGFEPWNLCMDPFSFRLWVAINVADESV